jgi:[acyl-carrier-protein] S-malonyltransferase
MAAALGACERLLEATEPAFGPQLKRLCYSAAKTSWPSHLLQPAIFVTSVGAATSVEAHGFRPDAAVGHSLGEFAALVAAGSLSFEDALMLVGVRGREMGNAGQRKPGGMAAVLMLDTATVAEICEAIDGVWVANFNSDSQTVVSGTDDALTEAAEKCLSAGARRVVRLDVPIAAHTPLMAPAAEALGEAIKDVEIQRPSCRFYSPVDARSHEEPDEIRRLLVSGITSPVRFSETLKEMSAAGVADFVEVGPGNVLRGLVKQNLPEARIAGVSSDEEAEALAFGLGRMQPA